MAELLAANQITIAKVLDGEQGIPGEPGADGKTSYFHIKYSAVANPTSSSEISETPLAYIGTYVDFTEADSTDPTKYTWSRFEGIQGEKGEQGIPGIGQDGRTSYLHIAYATSADGSEGFSISESANKTYIGQYTDFVSTDSTDYTKYSWTKIKGEMSAEQLAQLNQASEDASQAKTDVANLEIGGRNLAFSSLNFDRREIIYSISKGVEIIEYEDRTAIKFTGKNTAAIMGCYLITPYTVTVEEGVITSSDVDYDTFIISFDYKCESSLQTTTFQLRLFSYNDSTDSYVNAGRIISTNAPKAQLTATSNWKRAKTGVLNIPNPITLAYSGAALTGTFVIGIGYVNNPGVAFEMSKIKLEKGNRATDWTPAPEDVDAGIANAAKVATNFLGYDSTNGLIIGNKTSGSWSGYRSQILPGSFNVLDASSTILASFGPTTVIGEEANANMHLTFNNLSMVDKNGTNLFKVGDNRNADGIATLQWSSPDVPIDTSGSVTITVGNTISSIVSVYVDSVELSSSSYSFSGEEVTINNLTASSTKYIEIIYNTTDSAYYLTFGNRWSSSIIGEYSIAEGKSVTASGFASHAEGLGTKATGAYSHAEGAHTKAKGAYSHAGGYQTVADNSHMTVVGTYNTENSGKAFVVGVGDYINRRDGFTVDWDGNATVRRSLTLGTALSIANGGTGATTAAAARSNLGIKDYVVKEGAGTASGSYYRKWASGRAEYWHKFNPGALTIETARGNMYSGAYFDSSFESGLFNDVPQVNCYAHLGTDAYVIGTQVKTISKDKLTLRLWASGKVASNAGYNVHIYAFGTWK